MKTTVYAPGMRFYVSSKDLDDREDDDADTELSSMIDSGDNRSSFAGPSAIQN
jgi:hypothetical protein